VFGRAALEFPAGETIIHPDSDRHVPGSLWERLFYSHFKDGENGSLRFQIAETSEVFCLGTNSRDEQPVVVVKNAAFFRRCFLFGEIGFGEAYVDGLWDTDDLPGVLSWFLRNASHIPTFASMSTQPLLANILGPLNRLAHFMRRNSKKNSRENIAEHYDLSNEFFGLMLDETMAYSSAMYREGEDLHQAQINKFDVICRKLRLQPGMHLLEIGCGWGGFAIHAATHYSVLIDCITISQQQFEWATTRVQNLGLTNHIKIELKDYRELAGNYDRIVSIEMVEALGHNYLDTFFRKASRLLKPDGLMLIQAIMFPDPYFAKYLTETNWIQKHIFPGSCLLSLREIMNSIHRVSDLILWDAESIGPDYARTLRDWRTNVSRNESEIRRLGFDDRFFRKWNYYLTYCEVGFEHRYINDQQLLFARPMAKSL